MANDDKPPDDPESSEDFELVVFGYDLTDWLPSPETVAYRIVRYVLENVFKVGRGFFASLDALKRSIGKGVLTVLLAFAGVELAGFGIWVVGNALMCGAEAGKDQSNPIFALLQIIVLGLPGAVLRIIGFLVLLPTLMLEIALGTNFVGGILDDMACF